MEVVIPCYVTLLWFTAYSYHSRSSGHIYITKNVITPAHRKPSMPTQHLSRPCIHFSLRHAIIKYGLVLCTNRVSGGHDGLTRSFIRVLYAFWDKTLIGLAKYLADELIIGFLMPNDPLISCHFLGMLWCLVFTKYLFLTLQYQHKHQTRYET